MYWFINLVVFFILFLFLFIMWIWLFWFIMLVVICNSIWKWVFVLGKKIIMLVWDFFSVMKGVNIWVWFLIFCVILKFVCVIFWLLNDIEGMIFMYFEKILKYWWIIVIFCDLRLFRKYVLEGLINVYWFLLKSVILCFNSWFWGDKIII